MLSRASVYRLRLIDPLIDRLMAELPAILIVGPRGSGKTTTALRHASSSVRLDVPAQASFCSQARPRVMSEGRRRRGPDGSHD